MGVNTSELMPKRVQLLLELIPSAAKIALLQNRAGVGADAVQKEVEATTHTLGRQEILLEISSLSELEAAFASAVRQQADALLVSSSSIFTVGALKSSNSRRVTGCPRLTLGVNLSRLVG